MHGGAKPFIKWAGGKTQLLGEISKALPSDLSARESLIYVEPFVGGGAVLFWMLQHYPNIRQAVINDINRELICTYRIIKDRANELIASLQAIQNQYIPLDHNGRTQLYLQQRQIFNSGNIDELQTATLFIFLNRSCFNGLYRVNSKGNFNVPHGKYANPRICDEDNLLAISRVFQKVEILCGDFAQTLQYASPEAIYYIDPPYRPLTETSSFNSYSAGGFDDSEQIRLRDFCEQLSQRGAQFVASNSDPKNTNPDEDFFDSLYSNFNIQRVSATRMINSKASGRGKLNELLITSK